MLGKHLGSCTARECRTGEKMPTPQGAQDTSAGMKGWCRGVRCTSSASQYSLQAVLLSWLQGGTEARSHMSSWPGNAVSWETQLGSRQFLRHPRMDNHILTLWETGFCSFLSKAHMTVLCRPHSAFRIPQILDSPGQPGKTQCCWWVCCCESREHFWKGLLRTLERICFLLLLTQQVGSEREDSTFPRAELYQTGKTSPLTADPILGIAPSLLLASKTFLNAFHQNLIMPGSAYVQTTSPSPSQELSQYFSRRESLQLCTLPITLHLLEEQPNILTLPQIPRAKKVTREKLLAAPASCWHSLAFWVRNPKGFPHLLHGQSQRLPELLIHMFSAGPFPVLPLPGLPAAIARTWNTISSKFFQAPHCLWSNAPLFVSDQYPKAFPAMVTAVYSCMTDWLTSVLISLLC